MGQFNTIQAFRLNTLDYLTKEKFIRKLFLCLIFFSTSFCLQAQVFCQLTGASNPYDNVTVEAGSFPALVDIDADGDLDLFVGDFTSSPFGVGGHVQYFENIGTATASNFIERTGAANPLDVANSVGFFIGPTICIVDIDNDGDFDAFFGELTTDIFFYENVGTPTSPVFMQKTGAANPVSSIDSLNLPTLRFVDIDNDDDLDLFLAESLGFYHYYENTGTATTLNLVERTGIDNPFDGLSVIGQPTIDFSDVDCDGDFDAILGEGGGTILSYENIGTKTTPLFSLYTAPNNPFDGLDFGDTTSPNFGDIDGDGDEDLCIGNLDGVLHYFENKTPITFSNFQIKVLLQGPYNGTTMNTDLQGASLLSLDDPYGLDESVTVIPANVVDWILVELRDPIDNTTVVASRACFLRNDGQVIDLDGSIDVKFKNLAITTAYVAVRHRNHLGVMTNTAMTIN